MPDNKTVTFDAETHQLVPKQPTAEILAGASIAVWPTASAADIALARDAALIAMKSMDAAPGVTLDMLAATIATMAPAYRAMLAAAPTPAAQSAGQEVVAWAVYSGIGEMRKHSVHSEKDAAAEVASSIKSNTEVRPLYAAPMNGGERAQARAIHYPECWDTAAYPTLTAALAEVYASFKCTNDECGERAADAPQVGGMRKAHEWNAEGERCVKCGDKDWMNTECSGTPVVDARAEEVAALAPILRGMIEGGSYDDPAELYAADFEAPDGDVFVRRAADLLEEYAALSSPAKAPENTGDHAPLVGDDGWEVVRVNNLQPLLDALARAEEKGYMPDAMAEAWSALEVGEEVNPFGIQVDSDAPALSLDVSPAKVCDAQVDSGSLRMALNVLRRAGKTEVADELERSSVRLPQSAKVGGDERALFDKWFEGSGFVKFRDSMFAAWQARAALSADGGEDKRDADLCTRIIEAIEGECDGLGISEVQASNILAYLQYGAQPTVDDDDKRDAERYRTLRDVPTDLLNAPGIPCIAVPVFGNKGTMYNGADADRVVDAAIAANQAKGDA